MLLGRGVLPSVDICHVLSLFIAGLDCSEDFVSKSKAALIDNEGFQKHDLEDGEIGCAQVETFVDNVVETCLGVGPVVALSEVPDVDN